MLNQIPQFNYGMYNTSFGALDGAQQNPFSNIAPQMSTTAQTNLQSTPQTDTFQKTEETQQQPVHSLTKNQKIGIGAGILTLGGIVAAAILTKGKNLKPANLAEHIDFKPAKTMEEAVDYAKKKLGIKSMDFGDDLEMANWANEGLTNINNRFKGTANMPKKIGWGEAKDFEKLKEKEDSVIPAFALGQEIYFNKKYFSKDLITDVRKGLEALFPWKNKSEGTIKNKMLHGEDILIKMKLFDKYMKLLDNPKKFTRFDAMNAQELLDDYVASVKFAENNPLYFINKALKNNKIKQVLEKNGVKVSIEDFNKMTKEQQKEYMKKFFNVVYDNKISFIGHATHRGNSNFDVLYHEMGHLLHHMNTSLYEKMFGKLSGKAEKEFQSNAEKLATAGKVSWYAQTNQNEFVAEVFNALCGGAKLPEDVMKMYKDYKGPMLPNT